jgi:NAD(P)-dependent dehydrogenase (short-subunit alcohol dehydrogenase family)
MHIRSDVLRGKAIGLSTTVLLGLTCRELVARTREADLSGQVALITGGSRGLGLAIARELAQQQCRLALCARDSDELERAAEELRASGGEVLPIVCDVGIETDVTAMVSQVVAHYGRIDLLFTVAGVIEVGQFNDLDLDDFRSAMDVMFWGTLYPIVAVLPGMRARKYGRIAAITSIGGKISVPHLLSYSSAKFATVGLTEGLSAELARDGIHVTTIIPGLMRTGSHVNAWFKGNEAQQRGDYIWFSLGATSPMAARADRAARTIVRSVKRGEVERIFTLPFSLASRFHGIAPAATIRLMRLANAFLPSHAPLPGEVSTQRGEVVENLLDSKAHRVATTLGRRAEGAFNQHRGRSSSSEE